jgi:hypothetical protein
LDVIAKSPIRKEDIVARVLERLGDHPGSGAHHLGHASPRRLSTVARHGDLEDLHPARQCQVPAPTGAAVAGRILDAYETFAHAADTKALKVIIEA